MHDILVPTHTHISLLTALDGNIHLKNYEATPEGLLQSWMERFSDLTIYDDLEYLRKKDKPFFEF